MVKWILTIIFIVLAGYFSLNIFFNSPNSHITNDHIQTAHIESTTKVKHVTGDANKSNTPLIIPTSSTSNVNLDCIPLEEFVNKHEVTTVEKFFADNLLTESAVDSYLKTMDESQLKLEADSGNVQALFVLGMNYQWHSNHTAFQNPNLSLSDFETNDKTLDISILMQSRKFLWQAAIHGIAIAIPELANTYSIERNAKVHLEVDESKLLLEELTYKILFHDVAPNIAKLSGGNREKLIAEYNNLSKDSNGILNDVLKEWFEARSEIGENEIIELTVTDEFKTAYDKNFEICN